MKKLILVALIFLSLFGCANMQPKSTGQCIIDGQTYTVTRITVLPGKVEYRLEFAYGPADIRILYK